MGVSTPHNIRTSYTIHHTPYTIQHNLPSRVLAHINVVQRTKDAGTRVLLLDPILYVVFHHQGGRGGH
ncbi:hypothetical protein EON63_15270 [archaeon]|nr:MAG: hypothetical protein EON63_15270 [archaeon]